MNAHGRLSGILERVERSMDLFWLDGEIGSGQCVRCVRDELRFLHVEAVLDEGCFRSYERRVRIAMRKRG